MPMVNEVFVDTSGYSLTIEEYREGTIGFKARDSYDWVDLDFTINELEEIYKAIGKVLDRYEWN